MDTFGWNDGKYLVSSLIYDKQFISCFCYEIIMLKCLSIIKGSFTLAAAVCRFRSGLRQRRDRNFSISAEQRNRLPQTHEENAVMWISLKALFILVAICHKDTGGSASLQKVGKYSNFCSNSLPIAGSSSFAVLSDRAFRLLSNSCRLSLPWPVWPDG